MNSTKTNTDRILKEQNPSVADVNNALNKEVQQKLNEARALLQNKEDNSALVRAKEQLQQAVDQVPSTEGMTQKLKMITIQNNKLLNKKYQKHNKLSIMAMRLHNKFLTPKQMLNAL